MSEVVDEATDEATEPCLRCSECEWLTFPLRVAEFSELGMVGCTDELGEVLAHAASLIHVALRHPRLFFEGIGKNVEDALAGYASELGSELYELATSIALYDRSEWDT